MGPGEGPPNDSFKPKLYHAMESDERSDPNKPLDKGKGIDKGAHPSVGATSGSSDTSASYGTSATSSSLETHRTPVNVSISMLLRGLGLADTGNPG
jgi:hypothetical protein